MKTSEVAAAHSIDVGRWSKGFDEVLGRIASRFSRCEPLRNAGASMLGLVSDLGRKNCWTLSERSGHRSPDRFQHLAARAKSDADAVRDDLRAYPVDRPGDPMRCWWSICRPRNYAEAWVVRRRTAWGRGESQRRHSFTGGLLRFYTCPIER